MSDSTSISSFFIEGDKEIDKVFKSSIDSINEANFNPDSLTPKLKKVDTAKDQEFKKGGIELRYFFILFNLILISSVKFWPSLFLIKSKSLIASFKHLDNNLLYDKLELLEVLIIISGKDKILFIVIFP